MQSPIAVRPPAAAAMAAVMATAMAIGIGIARSATRPLAASWRPWVLLPQLRPLLLLLLLPRP